MTGVTKFVWISRVMLLRLDLCNVRRVVETKQVFTPWEVWTSETQWITAVVGDTLPWIQAELSILQGEEHTRIVRKLNKLLRQA